MTLPNIPIPEEDFKQHQSLRFKQRTDELAKPFEEQERESAYRQRDSDQFRARTDALIADFDAQDREADSAAFRQRTDALIAPFEEEEQAEVTPGLTEPSPEQAMTKTGPAPRQDFAKPTGRVEAVGQFEQGLPDEEAYSICGPVAALAFAQQTGRNPTLGEARAIAKRVGWTPEGGMNGVANQKRLLDEMGVASRLDTDVDFGEIAQDASSGNPVIVSTAKHYYYVNGYDPETGKLHVGKTGTARKGGAEWMTAEQIANLDGGINGALYVDHPGSPEPSVATKPLAGPGAEKAPFVAAGEPLPVEKLTRNAGVPVPEESEFQTELDKVIPRDFAGTFKRAMDEGNTPDLPSPMMGPFAPPQLGKPVQLDQETQGKIERGEALTLGDLWRNVTNWMRRQGETWLPAGPGALGTAEETVAKGFARGLTDTSGPGRVGGELAGDVGRSVRAAEMAGGGSGGVPDARDFSRYMEYKQSEAARRRARGLEAKPKSKADTSPEAEAAYYAEKEALEREEALASGKPIPTGRDVPPFEPDEPELMTRQELQEEIRAQRAASRSQRAAEREGLPTWATERGAPEMAQILDQTGKVLREVAVKVPPKVREEFLQPEALMPAKDVPLIRQVGDRIRNVIETMGEAGKELGERVHEWREGAEIEAQSWVERMPTIRKMKDGAQFAQVVDVLEGRAKPATPRIAQAAAEAKEVLDEVYARAQNAGVGVAEKIENYFPHIYKPEKIRELTDVKRRAAMIRRVMAERGGTADEAEQTIERYVRASRDRRHGSLEMSRLADLPGYEKTREALYNHLLTSARRIHEVAQFGKDDSIASKLMDRLGAEGYDRTLARELFQTIVGATSHSEAARRVSGAARVYHSVTRLGLSALLNATQSVNTATVTGTVRTLQSMAKAGWSQAEKDFADKTGVTLDTIIKEMKEGAGFTDKLGKFSAPGFSQVERFNRRVAAIAGRDFAREMAANAAKGGRGAESAKRALTKLRLDADAIVRRGGKLNEQEEIRAARAIVERTQFRVDPQDLPQWASHPLGKVVAQFRTFGYGQTAFVVREVIEEATKGNALPLVRFAILAPIAAGVATEARNAITGREPEEDLTMRIVQYGLGPLGVVGDMSKTVFGINSKYVPPERRVSQLTGSLLGPTVGTITEGAVGALKAAEGEPEGAMRMALRQVPVLGQLTVNRVFPYKKTEAATVPRNRDSGWNSRDSSRSRSR